MKQKNKAMLRQFLLALGLLAAIASPVNAQNVADGGSGLNPGAFKLLPPAVFELRLALNIGPASFPSWAPEASRIQANKFAADLRRDGASQKLITSAANSGGIAGQSDSPFGINTSASFPFTGLSFSFLFALPLSFWTGLELGMTRAGKETVASGDLVATDGTTRKTRHWEITYTPDDSYWSAATLGVTLLDSFALQARYGVHSTRLSKKGELSGDNVAVGDKYSYLSTLTGSGISNSGTMYGASAHWAFKSGTAVYIAYDAFENHIRDNGMGLSGRPTSVISIGISAPGFACSFRTPKPCFSAAL